MDHIVRCFTQRFPIFEFDFGQDNACFGANLVLFKHRIPGIGVSKWHIQHIEDLHSAIDILVPAANN